MMPSRFAPLIPPPPPYGDSEDELKRYDRQMTIYNQELARRSEDLKSDEAIMWLVILTFAAIGIWTLFILFGWRGPLWAALIAGFYCIAYREVRKRL